MRGAAIAVVGCVGAFFAMFMGIALVGQGASNVAQSQCSTPTSTVTGEPPLISYYVAAAARYHLGADGYAYLAAINHIETRFGTDVATSSAGAIGWMQFEPSTWARWGVSVTDPSSAPDPDDPQDAIYTAARYLAAEGAPRSWSGAIYGYNHASWYVQEVEGYAATYTGSGGMLALSSDIAAAWGTQSLAPPMSAAGHAVAVADPVSARTPASSTVAADSPASTDTDGAGCSSGGLNMDVTPVPGDRTVIMPDGLARPPAEAPRSVQAIVAAGDRIIDEPYSWGGGHCVEAMDQQSVQLSACPGNEENGGPGFDCSGSTSYALWGGGLEAMMDDSPQVAENFETLGAPGPGRWVTIMASSDHVYLDVAGAFLNTENGPYLHSAPQPPAAPSDTGPRWATANSGLDSLTRSDFVPRHPVSL